MKISALFFCLFLLAGCGYKPASHYAKNALDDSVFVDIMISRSDPQSGAVLIDALNTAIVSRFGKSLAPRDEAKTTIVITRGNYTISSLQRDQDGFTILYRCRVSMNVIVNSSKLKDKKFSINGNHDFATEPSSILSDTARNAAARESAMKALDMLLANIVLLGDNVD
ncbi:lipoprotein [Campylobacterota bacterium]|nr:lipoprotein [Campylobacterota bacterium]